MRWPRGDRSADDPPWYAQGLRFQCGRCGRCCAGEPGYVWLTDDDISRISRYLSVPEQELVGRYCRQVLFRISLMERPNGDCVFLTPAGCSIYEARPIQCRTFPFWSHLLMSRDRWEALRTRCKGVGQGRLYSREEIEAIRDGKRST